jgi:hypothetical protein
MVKMSIYFFFVFLFCFFFSQSFFLTPQLHPAYFLHIFFLKFLGFFSLPMIKKKIKKICLFFFQFCYGNPLHKPSFYAMPKNCIPSFSLFQVIFFFVLMKIYFRALYIPAIGWGDLPDCWPVHTGHQVGRPP